MSQLVAAGLVEAVAYPQRACFEAALLFARTEGILPGAGVLARHPGGDRRGPPSEPRAASA